MFTHLERQTKRDSAKGVFIVSRAKNVLSSSLNAMFRGSCHMHGTMGEYIESMVPWT